MALRVRREASDAEARAMRRLLRALAARGVPAARRGVGARTLSASPRAEAAASRGAVTEFLIEESAAGLRATVAGPSARTTHRGRAALAGPAALLESAVSRAAVLESASSLALVRTAVTVAVRASEKHCPGHAGALRASDLAVRGRAALIHATVGSAAPARKLATHGVPRSDESKPSISAPALVAEARIGSGLKSRSAPARATRA